MKHKIRKDVCTNRLDRGPYHRKTVREVMDLDPGYASEQMRSVGPRVVDRIWHGWFVEAMLHEQFGVHAPGSPESILRDLTEEQRSLEDILSDPTYWGLTAEEVQRVEQVAGEVPRPHVDEGAAGDERGPLVFYGIRMDLGRK